MARFWQLTLKMQPLILTLKMDDVSFKRLTELRGQYFPRERNYLGAHLTLFHALPPEKETEVRATWDEICGQCASVKLQFPAMKFLGKGTAVEVNAPAVEALRRQLSARWQGFLGAQDARVIRPHVTIQNKVAPEKARALFDQLSPNWRMEDGRGQGVTLWRYRGGPWEWMADWEFGARLDGAKLYQTISLEAV